MHGWDYRTKCFLSPLISQEKQAVIQAARLPEGHEVQGWLVGVEALDTRAVSTAYDPALQGLNASAMRDFRGDLYHRYQRHEPGARLPEFAPGVGSLGSSRGRQLRPREPWTSEARIAAAPSPLAYRLQRARGGLP
jgi:hypothetical protein